MSSLPNEGSISSTASICLFVSFLVLQCLVSMQVNGLPFGVVDTNPLTLNFRLAQNGTLRIPLVKDRNSDVVQIEFSNPSNCYTDKHYLEEDFSFSLGNESCQITFHWRPNVFIYQNKLFDELPVRLNIYYKKNRASIKPKDQHEFFLNSNEFCLPFFYPDESRMVLTLFAPKNRIWPECDVNLIMVGSGWKPWVFHGNILFKTVGIIFLITMLIITSGVMYSFHYNDLFDIDEAKTAIEESSASAQVNIEEGKGSNGGNGNKKMSSNKNQKPDT